jgi:hypothetical protein
MPRRIGPGSQRTPHGGGGSPARPPGFESGPFDPTAAIKWGFDMYRSDLANIALPIVVLETVVLFASLVIPKGVGTILRSASRATSPDLLKILEYSAGTVLGILSTAYAAASLYPYLLNLARGRPVEVSEAFRPGPHLPNALKLASLMAVGTTLGLALCAVPGVAFVFASTTAFPALIDRDLDAVTALRESFDHAKSHWSTIAIFGLSSLAMTLIGVAFCGIGAVLVSIPIVMLAQIYVYLSLEGETPTEANLE